MLQPKKDKNREHKLKAFDRLLTIMEELRLNCPWDKKQTNESLRILSIEEIYELGDAIINDDSEEIKKELGDIMLHMTFYSLIAEEKGQFDISDVLNSISEKLIHRHPHIYSDTKVQDEEEVKRNWEKLKLKEKGNESVLGGVPKGLPAMVKAYRIQEKAKGVGFEWEKKEQVWDKVEEEIEEFQQEQKLHLDLGSASEKMKEEFGDILFSLINYARFIGIDPEESLERCNQKFITRFQHIEQSAKSEGKSVDSMSLEEMDKYWNEAKSKS